MGAWFVQYRTEICSIDRLLEKQGRFRACLSCFGNRNKKADSEGSLRGLPRLQKLEKSGFNSFLQCFLCSKELALLRSINKRRTNPSSR